MHLLDRALLPLTVMVFMLVSPPVHGQYYRYTDAHGVMRFTDDIANVPQGQRPDVKTYESVKSDPVVQTVESAGQTQADLSAAMPGASGEQSQGGTWDEKIDNQANDLDRMQVELNKTYLVLQAEREALAVKTPPAGAGDDAQAAYRQQVKSLNAKIDAYEARYAEFREKEKAFKNQYAK